MEETKQVGARISADLYRRLRVLAAERDRTIGDLLQEAVKDLLRKYSKRS
jgi:hypothetical protein